MPLLAGVPLAASQLFHSTVMALKLINGVYHWRKMVDGHSFSKSTKTADKKVAEQMAVMWEADALKTVLIQGTKPVNLHAVIKAFTDARVNTPSHRNSIQHLRHFRDGLPNIRMSELTQAQIAEVVAKRRAGGISHNTAVVMVSYWNAAVKFAEDQKWTTAPRLPKLKNNPAPALHHT